MAAIDVPPLDEKAKRTRELLASFYSTEPSAAGAASSTARIASLDSINSPSFEPEVYMNLLLEAISVEVRQILPRGLNRRHRHSDSTGSTTSSRSNPLREDKLSRTNTQRTRSHLLESHLAKLFEQKMEIFTKVEYNQESVISTIIKLCLKSLQEFVRLQTFNRSGYQQIQLDVEFLKSPLKEFVDDEAAVNFLLKEVINAAHERCLDPIPLEPAILDKLINAKLLKSKDPSSQ